MSKINFDSILRSLRITKKTIAKRIAKKAVNHFKGNFRKGGFVDSVVRPWESRQNADNGRAILVKSGALRRSIKELKVTKSKVVVGTNSTRYASYHNKGIGKMPKRQFIGRSTALNGQIEKIIKREIRKALSA